MWLTARENRDGDLSTSCWRSWRRHSILALSLCLSISISVSQPLTHSPSDCPSPSNMNVFSVSYKVSMHVWESVLCRRTLATIFNLWNAETVLISQCCLKPKFLNTKKFLLGFSHSKRIWIHLYYVTNSFKSHQKTSCTGEDRIIFRMIQWAIGSTL